MHYLRSNAFEIVCSQDDHAPSPHHMTLKWKDAPLTDHRLFFDYNIPRGEELVLDVSSSSNSPPAPESLDEVLRRSRVDSSPHVTRLRDVIQQARNDGADPSSDACQHIRSVLACPSAAQQLQTYLTSEQTPNDRTPRDILGTISKWYKAKAERLSGPSGGLEIFSHSTEPTPTISKSAAAAPPTIPASSSQASLASASPAEIPHTSDAELALPLSGQSGGLEVFSQSAVPHPVISTSAAVAPPTIPALASQASLASTSHASPPSPSLASLASTSQASSASALQASPASDSQASLAEAPHTSDSELALPEGSLLSPAASSTSSQSAFSLGDEPSSPPDTPCSSSTPLPPNTEPSKSEESDNSSLSSEEIEDLRLLKADLESQRLHVPDWDLYVNHCKNIQENLTICQKMAVFLFSLDCTDPKIYKVLNEALLSRRAPLLPGQPFYLLYRHLWTAIHALPSAQLSAHDVFYRGVDNNFPKGQLVAGAVLVWHGFVSCSASREEALRFSTGGILFELHGIDTVTHSASIKNLSIFPDEQGPNHFMLFRTFC